MAFIIDKENKTVTPKKDCTTCISLKSCKFHAKMRELCNSNEFYQMNEYLESNNSLKVFEKHASCQFYHYKYPTPVDGQPIGLDADPEIISAVLRAIPSPKHCNGYSHDVKTNVVEYKWYNASTKESGTVELPLTQVLSNYTFAYK